MSRQLSLFRLYQTHVSDVCQSVMRLHLALCAKMAKWTEVLFGVKTLGGQAPKNTVLDRGPNPPQQMGGKSTFNGAFAKLLWSHVRITFLYSTHFYKHFHTIDYR